MFHKVLKGREGNTADGLFTKAGFLFRGQQKGVFSRPMTLIETGESWNKVAAKRPEGK
jgi:hypothetical protein